MIQVFIANSQVDIDEITSINITFQFDDLINPTSIKNDLSKTIQFPATAKNNKIFENYWHPNHSIYTFNASKRIDCVISNNGIVVSDGYIQLNRIEQVGGYPKYYNCTFYGGRGNFLYDIDGKYLEDLDMSGYNYQHTLARTSIISSWTNENYRYMLSYSGLYDNFNNDRVFTSFDDNTIYPYSAYSPSEVFIPLQNGFITYNGDVTSFEGVTDVNNWLTNILGCQYDASTGNFVIYNSTSISFGSTSEPEDWQTFTIANKGISGSIRAMCCVNTSSTFGKYVIVTSTGSVAWSQDSISNSYSTVNLGSITSVTNVTIDGWQNGNYVDCTINTGMIAYSFRITSITSSTQSAISNPVSGTNASAFADPKIYSGYTWDTYANGTTLYAGLITQSSIPYTYGNPVANNNTSNGATFDYETGRFYYYGDSNVINVRVPGATISDWNAYSINTNLSGYYFYSIQRINGYYIAIVKRSIDTVNRLVFSNDLSAWVQGDYGFFSDIGEELNEHQRNEFRSAYQRPSIRLKNIINQIISDSGWTVNLDSAFFNTTNPYWQYTWVLMERLTYDSSVSDLQSNNVRSFNILTYSDLVTKGISQLDFLVSYLKTFGLILVINDNINKVASILTKNTFFSAGNIIDWTYKVDNYNNPYTTPIPFDYKFGLLKYNNVSSQYEEIYNTKYNRDYGIERIDTGYEFNDNEIDYIDGQIFNNIIVSKEYDIYFKGRSSVNPYADDKSLPALFTRTNNMMNYNKSSMHLVFSLTKTLTLPAKITDDSTYMLSSGEYSWTNVASDTTSVSQIVTGTRTYSYLTGYCLDFGTSSADYGSGNVQQDISCIYYRYHESWLNERLNANNMVETKYINLTPTDIYTFSFANFVKINDVMYHVIKIYDYNVAGGSSTKVDLIRINDVTNYTTGQRIAG